MSIETIPGSNLSYCLVNFDEDGHERPDPQAPNGLLSDLLAQELATCPITDCLFMSHGWQGDIPAAKRQYDAWSAAMVGCTADLAHLHAIRDGFMPLIIGVHWPSLPWGEEDPTAHGVSFASGGVDPLSDCIEKAATRLAKTPAAREALRVVFDAALVDLTPDELPVEVTDAYRTLASEAWISAAGPAGAPGNDLERFDPEWIYQEALEQEGTFGTIPGLGALLVPLRQLSFWRMKARARRVGESGVGDLLRRLQTAASERDLRFHLMGHSFGCIVVSAAIQGQDDGPPLVAPVHSLFLAQGALSLWSYCSAIPEAQGQPGYFYPLIARGQVAGPIVTTQSRHDTAVRVFYPMGAGLAGQRDFAPGKLPKYGGVGVFGIQGPGIPREDREMRPPESDYGFRPGLVYNLEGSGYINQGGGAVGAHNDIAKPAVAHAFWQAIGTPV